MISSRPERPAVQPPKTLGDVAAPLGLGAEDLLYPGLPTPHETDSGALDAAPVVGVGAETPLSGSEPLTERSQSCQVEAQCMADVEAEDVAFLWRPRLPLGKLTLLQGDPGQGKSYIVAAIATALSIGRGFPGETDFQPVRSLIFTAEDGLSDTLRPRLEAMGADLSLIFAYDQAVDLSRADGFAAIEREVARLRPALVVVDPIVAYLGGRIDMHRANEMRSILAPLSKLAGDHSCAVVAVLHLSKARSGRALHAGLGSVDFSAAARSILLAGSSANDPGSRALLHIKCNVAEQAPALGYRITAGQFGWTGPSTLAAADLLGPETAGEQRTAEEEAARWLKELLCDGPIKSREVRREAEAAGLAWRTVERSRRSLGVRVRRVGFGEAGAWEWTLSDQRPPNDAIDRQENSLAGNGEFGGLCDGAAPDTPGRKVDL
jgi:hypothetical protein